jgi:hypothetical protein
VCRSAGPMCNLFSRFVSAASRACKPFGEPAKEQMSCEAEIGTGEKLPKEVLLSDSGGDFLGRLITQAVLQTAQEVRVLAVTVSLPITLITRCAQTQSCWSAYATRRAGGGCGSASRSILPVGHRGRCDCNGLVRSVRSVHFPSPDKTSVAIRLPDVNSSCSVHPQVTGSMG